MKEKILCRVLTGPTASGKTALSLRLAKKAGWDILCMDSMQVYRRMNIGTAKPTEAERSEVPHHLLDLCEPDEPFSVADYREEAERLVQKLWREGREVLFVGGTGLYLQALTHPMAMGHVAANPELRETLRRMAEEPDGRRLLHERLEKEDPETAARLPLNDIRRVIRAIEVTEGTGIPFSRQPPREEESAFRWRIAATCLERPVLYSRIHERVDRMIEAGLAEEVRGLLESGIPETAQSMNGLGYKEMVPFLHGEISLEEAADRIRLGSRHYAKRQETFLRRLEDIRYVNADDSDAEEQIRKILDGKDRSA